MLANGFENISWPFTSKSSVDAHDRKILLGII